MRRDLLSRGRTEAPSGGILWINHGCLILTSGYILDHEGEPWEISEGLRQASWGLTDGEVKIPGGVFDLSTLTISMRMRGRSSSIITPLVIGSSLWVETTSDGVKLTGSSGDYFSSAAEEDLSLVLRSSSGIVDLFLDGVLKGRAGVVLDSGTSVTFKAGRGLFMDELRIYRSLLSDQHVQVLSKSYLRGSVQEVKQFF